jgi:monofunctional biosynthetic peptidoglycan transglycosylase
VTAKKALRALGRWTLGAAAVGFAALAYVYLTLPDVRPLITTNPTSTAFMELRAQEARAKGLQPRHVQRWIAYSRISPHLKRAVLVAEDDAFWQHEGVDFEQLQESLEVDWARGRLVRGGSTITQQLAKNLYLSPSKNPLRKLEEFIVARRLEAELKKARIFELYLNVIEWGDGIYGAEAAARTYFRVSAADLDANQAARLAGAIVNPRVLNPAHPTARLLRREQLILHRMGAVSPPPAEVQSSAEPTQPAAEVQ